MGSGTRLVGSNDQATLFYAPFPPPIDFYDEIERGRVRFRALNSPARSRVGGSVLGGLVVLVLVAALVLPRLFTSEQLKGYVGPPLEEATSRQVEIDDIGLRVLRTPAIRVSGVRLANAEGYGPAPAVEARALNVNVALWLLFVGTIRPTSVALVEPVVRYVVAEDGATNFDDLGSAADATESGGDPLGGIPVSNLRVSGAHSQTLGRTTRGTLCSVASGRIFSFGHDA